MGWDVATVVMVVAPLFPIVLERSGDCMGMVGAMGQSATCQISNVHKSHVVILLY